MGGQSFKVRNILMQAQMQADLPNASLTDNKPFHFQTQRVFLFSLLYHEAWMLYHSNIIILLS